MKYIVLVFLFFSFVLAQQESRRWQAADISYKIKEPQQREYKFDNSSAVNFSLSGLKNTYWFFFSDLDGDNCPFHPTCSEFFVQSVKSTNFLKGSLMFADRFVRDANFFKDIHQYSLKNNRLYDPVNNYKLHYNDIKINK